MSLYDITKQPVFFVDIMPVRTQTDATKHITLLRICIQGNYWWARTHLPICGHVSAVIIL